MAKNRSGAVTKKKEDAGPRFQVVDHAGRPYYPGSDGFSKEEAERHIAQLAAPDNEKILFCLDEGE